MPQVKREAPDDDGPDVKLEDGQSGKKRRYT